MMLFRWIAVSFVLLITFFTAIITLVDLLLGRLNTLRLDKRLCWWAKSILNFAKVKYRIHGRDKITFEKDKKYIVMCNHASLFDIPLAVMALKTSVRMLVKKELIQVPIWGKAMLVSDFVSIDRKNSKKALKDLKVAESILKKGIVLWISPEGTRSITGQLQPFKRGGFKLSMDVGATIIPMGIRGSYDVMPAKTLRVSRGKNVEVHFGKPIDASSFNNKNRKELINKVEKQIKYLSGQ